MTRNLPVEFYPELFSETRFRKMIENSPDGIMMLSPGGLVTEINTSAEKILGYTKAGIVGRDCIDMVVFPDDAPKARLALQSALKHPYRAIVAEIRNKMPDGGFKWLQGSCINLCRTPHVDAIVVNFHDITQRKNDQKELLQKEEQLSVIYNNTLHPMWVLNVEGLGVYRFISANVAFTSFFKIKDVAGRLSGELYTLKHFDLIIQKYNEAYTTGNVTVFVITDRFSTGKKTIEMTVVPVRNQSNRVVQLLVAVNDITSQQKANEELQELNSRLRRLASHLQNVREEERTSMAREIHDELGQQLTVLKMDIAWLNKKLAGREENVQTKINSILQLIDTTINTVRIISSELRPSILDNLGLAEAIAWQSSEFIKRTNVHVKFSSNVQNTRFPSDISIHLFRIFQESLTNIARHANATEVICILNKTKKSLRLLIEDNGAGFDIKQQRKKETLGLLGIKERIAMLHGTCNIESGHGKGTCISVKIPLPEMSND